MRDLDNKLGKVAGYLSDVICDIEKGNSSVSNEAFNKLLFTQCICASLRKEIKGTTLALAPAGHQEAA